MESIASVKRCGASSSTPIYFKINSELNLQAATLNISLIGFDAGQFSGNTIALMLIVLILLDLNHLVLRILEYC